MSVASWTRSASYITGVILQDTRLKNIFIQLQTVLRDCFLLEAHKVSLGLQASCDKRRHCLRKHPEPASVTGIQLLSLTGCLAVVSAWILTRGQSDHKA